MARIRQKDSLLYDVCTKLSKEDFDAVRNVARTQGTCALVVRVAVLEYLEKFSDSQKAAS